MKTQCLVVRRAFFRKPNNSKKFVLVSYQDSGCEIGPFDVSNNMFDLVSDVNKQLLPKLDRLLAYSFKLDQDLLAECGNPLGV